ncbi:MAG: nitrogenase molybdenum-iron protein subunit beta [Nitrospinae bacterium]|nr:nitrogenase molybdenum-iron protein subunit beta [Nitrospinota bacterium]
MKELNIADHNTLFKREEYQTSRQKKKAFENCASAEEVQKTAEYTRSAEYKEKNMKREALTINPSKACQPLGAILAAVGFDGCLPYVHGSQGCTAYFRSHFNRHFKEPFAAVSDSMTEDSAVFGGQKNMIAGLKNAHDIYKPKMIAVSTTCMAEVIGDDLNAFIKNSRKEGSVPERFPIPFAHTPSFVGSHVTGYDNMMRGMLFHLTHGTFKVAETEKINIIPGFDGYTVGNIAEIKRILDLMDVKYIVLGDNSDILNTPMDGEFRLYSGGTTIEQTKEAMSSKATFSLLGDSTYKATAELLKNDWMQTYVGDVVPLGVSGTDKFLMKVSEITGKPIPKELEKERGQALDAIADSNYYLHGKKFAIYGDPSYVEAITDFLMECGAEPKHVVSTNGTKRWGKELTKKLAGLEFGKKATVHHGADLWQLRSLMATEPVDFLIGNTHGKIMAKELNVPLVRIGFPIFDRHHLHRYPVFGYKGVVNLLQWTVNTLLEDLDRNAGEHNFDYVR